MEFDDQDQGRRHKIELISYEIGDWRCRCGARQGHAQRYDLECKTCKIQTGNGVIDGHEERCSRCGGPIVYVTCAECNTRVTLDILWRIENGDLHPRELVVPLKATLRRFVDGSPRDTLPFTLVEFPLMLGINEKGGTFHFASPGLLWIDFSIYVFDRDMKYDRQTDPLKIFEALLSRTFSSYRSPHSLKSYLQQEDISHGDLEGFSRRIAQIAQTISAISTDFFFDCLVSATESLTRNMAILNRSSTKNLVAPFISETRVLLGQDDILTRNPLGKVTSTSLDENGIVVVGTLVNPGDVLVGIESWDETSADAKLLRVIGLEGERVKIDSSRVYSGIFPARVLSVDVTPGKTRISIRLSVEASIGVGDTLVTIQGS